jgi:hypothetical protein
MALSFPTPESDQGASLSDIVVFPEPVEEVKGLQLERMPQQAGVRTLDDDWTGRSDTAQRRRLQNRIHQRTFRMFTLVII